MCLCENNLLNVSECKMQCTTCFREKKFHYNFNLAVSHAFESTPPHFFRYL